MEIGTALAMLEVPCLIQATHYRRLWGFWSGCWGCFLFGISLRKECSPPLPLSPPLLLWRRKSRARPLSGCPRRLMDSCVTPAPPTRCPLTSTVWSNTTHYLHITNHFHLFLYPSPFCLWPKGFQFPDPNLQTSGSQFTIYNIQRNSGKTRLGENHYFRK